ncbi:MAG: hypothetical protein KAJ46_02445 [Sedimentisphaerales bacterium]|nr:hypothetical protein [Sedimentisphaerales bacterium]
MSVYHQMGHDSQNLLSEENLSGYKGALLSPVNYTEEKVVAQIKEYTNDKFEMIFDPQLYYPNSERGELPQWSYFPNDVDTADQTSLTWWENLIADLVVTVKRIRSNAVCSPVVVPRVYSNEYYDLNKKITKNLQEKLSDGDIKVFQTLLVRLSELTRERAAEIASIISSGTANEVFLVLVSDVEPRRELSETEDIKGAMKLINYLENSDIRVLVGYSSSDLILWKFAGASNCASGKFFNLRRFTPARWEVPAEGGGQLPYWFEESMMAYLRESDLIRVRKANLISHSSISNPYGQEILHQKDSEPTKPWLALSWRQYMYWFADFECRFNKGKVITNSLLENAENTWNQLESNNILMEEQRNNANWLRPWRRAVLEAFED